MNRSSGPSKELDERGDRKNFSIDRTKQFKRVENSIFVENSVLLSQMAMVAI